MDAKIKRVSCQVTLVFSRLVQVLVANSTVPIAFFLKVAMEARNNNNNNNTRKKCL